jgi:hypothetical protein
MADIKLVMQAETAPVDRAVRLLDNLQAELRDVKRAQDSGLISTKRAANETKRLNDQIARLNTATRGSAADFRKFEKSVYGSGKAMRQKEIAMQQAGYQLQDFIVQVQAGTNPLIAFSQQGSQLAGFFAGPWGAAIGLGIAALGGLGTALLGVTNKAKDTQQAFEDLGSNVDSFSNFADSAALSADQLSEKFGVFATTVKAAYEALRDIQRMKVSSSIIAVAGEGPLSLEASKAIAGGKYQSFMEKKVREFLNLQGVKSRVASPLIGEFGGILGQLTQSQGFEQQLEYLNRLNEILKGQFGTDLENALAPQEVLDFYEKINTAIIEVSTALNAERLAQKAADEAAKKTQQEKDKVRLAAEERAMALQEDYIARGKKAQDERDKARLAAEERSMALQEDYIARSEESAKTEAQTREKLRLQSFAHQSQLIQNQKNEEIQTAVEIYNERKATRKRLDLEAYEFQSDLIAKQKQNELDVAVEIYKKRKELEEDLHNRRVRLQMMMGTTPLFINMDALERAAEIYRDRKSEEGKKPPVLAESMASIIKGMEEQANLQRQLVGLSDQEADRLQILYDLKEQNKDASGKMTEADLKKAAKRIAAINAETAALEAQEQRLQGIADTLANEFENSFMSMIDGTKSVDDAFRDMSRNIISYLYRVLVLQQMIRGFGTILGGSGNPILSAIGGALSNYSMDGGGYTGSGPRSGGLDGKGGFMAMLHPNETVIDHTKGQSAQGVTVVQNINISTGVQQTVRNEIRTLMPQIAESAKAAVADAKRRGGSYGRAFS